MFQVIFRVAKVKTRGQALSITKHNYRLMNTPNADAERTASLNHEYINTGQLDYWTLAEQRINEVVTRKVRADQVRAVEVVLTASPDWFKRGPDGQADDVRGSQWVTDNLNFLKTKFGEKNVVSFTLHQDETTPHIHAVVIPLTEKGRLSAQIVFNPRTLRQLQTDYAAAMAGYGLTRGVEGSRRQHLDMKQMYGQQSKTAAELAGLGRQAGAPAFVLPKLPRLGIGGDEWKAEQERRINAELDRRDQAAARQVRAASDVAVANASAGKRADVLERQLNISEKLKQQHFTQLKERTADSDRLAVHLAQGGAVPKVWLERGAALREQARQQTTGMLAQTLKSDFVDLADYYERVRQQGYRLRKATADNPHVIQHQASGASFTWAEVRPGGRKLGEQIDEALRARAERAERASAAEQARETARQRAELKAFKDSHWPRSLNPCARLVVPLEKAGRIYQEFKDLKVGLVGGYISAAAETCFQDEGGGKTTLHVQYLITSSPAISGLFARIKAAGGEVYESPRDQVWREQEAGKPREQQLASRPEPAQSQDRERD